jgi:peptidoglycan/LPS O-acetylase OafA/YrhL
MMSAAGGARIYQLQSLRFVAAALVLYGHALMEARQHGSRFAQHWTYDLPWGGGVDIFFVISGFIILFIARDAPRSLAAAGDFIAKRIIRLVPLYWIFTAAMAAVILLLPGRVQEGGLTLGGFVKSLLFVPYIHASSGEVRPVLGQGWTLNYEFFFYLVFAATMIVTRRRFAAVSGVLLICVVVGTSIALPPALASLLNAFLVLFVIGMALAHFFDRLPRHGGIVALLIVLAAAAWIAVVPPEAPADVTWRLVARGVPAVMLVYATLLWRAPPRWITHGTLPMLGDASYALYLSHPFVVNAVLIVFAKLHLPFEGVFVLVAVFAAVAASVVIFRWVETPILLALTRGYRNSALGKRARTEPTALATNLGTNG